MEGGYTSGERAQRSWPNGTQGLTALAVVHQRIRRLPDNRSILEIGLVLTNFF
jgi:hypothetical protein